MDISKIHTIAFDADDTLWVNEPFYREVETTIAKILRPYAPENHFMEKLYEREKQNLRIFGYGAKGFTLSLIETAIELSDKRITVDEIQQIVELGKSLLQKPVELLPGVVQTIKHLSADYPLMTITKGDLFDQESKIARSGIADFFQAIEIVSEKTPETYTKILKRNNISPENFCMVGNSLKSDILPVLAIGGHAIHIPYHTTWVHEQVEPSQFETAQFTSLKTISDLTKFFSKANTL